MARLHNDRWVGDARTVGGGRKTFRTRTEAEAYERDPFNLPKTVGDVFPDLARRLWGGTADERNCLRIADELVRRLDRDRLIKDINDLVVVELRDALEEEGNAPSTCNTKLTRLSKLLKEAKKRGHLSELPEIELYKGIRNNRLRYLTKDEEKALFEHLPFDSRQYATFLLYTGCRFSEALKLRWIDVLPDDVVFWDTKNGDSRSVTMTAQAREVLAWARGRNGENHDPDRPFGFMRYETFRNHWKKARKAVRLEKDPWVVPHVLRHTCASRLAMAGVHVVRIKAWMGHSTLAMTERYMKLAPNAMGDVARALEAA